jgi:hypothetical protein
MRWTRDTRLTDGVISQAAGSQRRLSTAQGPKFPARLPRGIEGARHGYNLRSVKTRTPAHAPRDRRRPARGRRLRARACSAALCARSGLAPLPCLSVCSVGPPSPRLRRVRPDRGDFGTKGRTRGAPRYGAWFGLIPDTRTPAYPPATLNRAATLPWAPQRGPDPAWPHAPAAGGGSSRSSPRARRSRSACGRSAQSTAPPGPARGA